MRKRERFVKSVRSRCVEIITNKHAFIINVFSTYINTVREPDDDDDGRQCVHHSEALPEGAQEDLQAGAGLPQEERSHQDGHLARGQGQGGAGQRSVGRSGRGDAMGRCT